MFDLVKEIQGKQLWLMLLSGSRNSDSIVKVFFSGNL